MVQLMLPRLRLRRVNDLIFALIVLINLYIIVAPVLPQVTFWWNSHHSSRQAQLRRYIAENSKPRAIKPSVPGPHELVIPAMMLKAPTLEGPESDWFDLLYKGIWRWPGSSTPDKGGNTVFLAHRFSYTGPRGAFYYLDKLKLGDEIGVNWKGRLYTYTVVSSQTVPPTDTAVEANTSDAQVTLFTCAPLWRPVNRLVVVAKLKGTSP